jgi:hypothetical protein
MLRTTECSVIFGHAPPGTNACPKVQPVPSSVA